MGAAAWPPAGAPWLRAARGGSENHHRRPRAVTQTRAQAAFEEALACLGGRLAAGGGWEEDGAAQLAPPPQGAAELAARSGLRQGPVGREGGGREGGSSGRGSRERDIGWEGGRPSNLRGKGRDRGRNAGSGRSAVRRSGGAEGGGRSRGGRAVPQAVGGVAVTAVNQFGDQVAVVEDVPGILPVSSGARLREENPFGDARSNDHSDAHSGVPKVSVPRSGASPPCVKLHDTLAGIDDPLCAEAGASGRVPCSHSRRSAGGWGRCSCRVPETQQSWLHDAGMM